MLAIRSIAVGLVTMRKRSDYVVNFWLPTILKLMAMSACKGIYRAATAVTMLSKRLCCWHHLTLRICGCEHLPFG